MLLLEHFVGFVNFEGFLDFLLHAKAILTQILNYFLLLLSELHVTRVSVFKRVLQLLGLLVVRF